MNAYVLPSFVALGLLAASGCGSNSRPVDAAGRQPAPLPVTTASVLRSDWPVLYEVAGTVRARTAAQISARTMATVLDVRARAGDRVREGQTLITLDSRDSETRQRQAEAARAEAHSAALEAEQAIAAAKAQLDLSQATFQRMNDLYKKTSISTQEFDEASARVQVSRANYDMARARREQVKAKIAQSEESLAGARIQAGYSTIAAPFSGVVTERHAEPGSLAVPGAALLVIERDSGFRLEVPVEEGNVGKVRSGQAVAVILDGTSPTLSARVSEIVPAIDPGSRSFIAKIDLPASAGVRSGQFGRARFSLSTRSAVTIPTAAVVDRGQMHWAYVVKDKVAQSRVVTLGERVDERIEVLSGLSEGERVVVPIPLGLTDGRVVEERP